MHCSISWCGRARSKYVWYSLTTLCRCRSPRMRENGPGTPVAGCPGALTDGIDLGCAVGCRQHLNAGSLGYACKGSTILAVVVANQKARPLAKGRCVVVVSSPSAGSARCAPRSAIFCLSLALPGSMLPYPAKQVTVTACVGRCSFQGQGYQATPLELLMLLIPLILLLSMQSSYTELMTFCHPAVPTVRFLPAPSKSGGQLLRHPAF